MAEVDDEKARKRLELQKKLAARKAGGSTTSLTGAVQGDSGVSSTESVSPRSAARPQSERVSDGGRSLLIDNSSKSGRRMSGSSPNLAGIGRGTTLTPEERQAKMAALRQRASVAGGLSVAPATGGASGGNDRALLRERLAARKAAANKASDVDSVGPEEEGGYTQSEGPGGGHITKFRESAEDVDDDGANEEPAKPAARVPVPVIKKPPTSPAAATDDKKKPVARPPRLASSPRITASPHSSDEAAPITLGSPRGTSSVAIPPMSPKEGYGVGDSVEALWDEDGKYYAAEVTAANGDGTYTVRFTEYGNEQNNTATENMRLVARKAQKDQKDRLERVRKEQEEKKRKAAAAARTSGAAPKPEEPAADTRWRGDSTLSVPVNDVPAGGAAGGRKMQRAKAGTLSQVGNDQLGGNDMFSEDSNNDSSRQSGANDDDNVDDNEDDAKGGDDAKKGSLLSKLFGGGDKDKDAKKSEPQKKEPAKKEPEKKDGKGFFDKVFGGDDDAPKKPSATEPKKPAASAAATTTAAKPAATQPAKPAAGAGGFFDDLFSGTADKSEEEEKSDGDEDLLSFFSKKK